MGANEYISKLRIEKAITLISGTDMPFSEIAEKTGFTTPSYFSTAFKQYTGETPSQYKERKKKGLADTSYHQYSLCWLKFPAASQFAAY